MRLYSLSDSDPDDYDSLGWAIAVWAPTEAEAITFALANYAGDARIEEVDLRVTSTCDSAQPAKPGVHEEGRLETLRLAGWMQYDGESACECCDLYAFGIAAHRVCHECCLCPTCRATEADDPCDHCRPAVNAKTSLRARMRGDE